MAVVTCSICLYNSLLLSLTPHPWTGLHYLTLLFNILGYSLAFQFASAGSDVLSIYQQSLASPTPIWRTGTNSVTHCSKVVGAQGYSCFLMSSAVLPSSISNVMVLDLTGDGCCYKGRACIRLGGEALGLFQQSRVLFCPDISGIKFPPMFQK